MNAMTEQIEQLAGQLRQEFVEDAHEMLDRLDNIAGEAAESESDPKALMQEARRIIHTLKGSGGTHDYPDVSIIALRAEDYLADLDGLTARQQGDVQAYTDAMRRALTGEAHVAGTFKEAVRQLPARWNFNVGDVEIREVEVLLVSSAKVLSHKVRNELEACGYRVTIVANPIMALELAVRTQPDLVIASAMLDIMTGVDLARALGSISGTESIPFALLTSFNRGHHELAGLPVDAAVIRIGSHFGDDVADVMSRFEIG